MYIFSYLNFLHLKYMMKHWNSKFFVNLWKVNFWNSVSFQSFQFHQIQLISSIFNSWLINQINREHVQNYNMYVNMLDSSIHLNHWYSMQWKMLTYNWSPYGQYNKYGIDIAKLGFLMINKINIMYLSHIHRQNMDLLINVWI